MELLVTTEFEEGGWITVARVQRRAPGIELLLDVRSDAENFERQAWRIECGDPRACRFGAEPSNGVQLLSEHMLLSPHVEPPCVPAFRGRASDPRRAVADMWERHTSIAEMWVPFDTFFNRQIPIMELLGTSGGILAEAPQRFAEAYSEVLRTYEAEPYIVRGNSPLRRSERGCASEHRSVELLFLESYDFVIAAGFSAKRVPVESILDVA
ncbi:MAG: hypothetical protein H0U67_07165 [Gemmatimonadetes bacterium]|nr:hypothetical protein [Gemmatimonadota bacterium]